ncbi:hypothetical protein FUT69_04150 [Xylella taiwanensis]|nr:hypothetical protein [Xylella taiwanensis]
MTQGGGMHTWTKDSASHAMRGGTSNRVTSHHIDYSNAARVFISRSNHPYGWTSSQSSGVKAGEPPSVHVPCQCGGASFTNVGVCTVIMRLSISGEAATKVMDGYAEFTQGHVAVPWRNMRNRMAHGNCDINLEVV